LARRVHSFWGHLKVRSVVTWMCREERQEQPLGNSSSLGLRSPVAWVSSSRRMGFTDRLAAAAPPHSVYSSALEAALAGGDAHSLACLAPSGSGGEPRPRSRVPRVWAGSQASQWRPSLPAEGTQKVAIRPDNSWRADFLAESAISGGGDAWALSVQFKGRSYYPPTRQHRPSRRPPAHHMERAASWHKGADCRRQWHASSGPTGASAGKQLSKPGAPVGSSPEGGILERLSLPRRDAVKWRSKTATPQEEEEYSAAEQPSTMEDKCYAKRSPIVRATLRPSQMREVFLAPDDDAPNIRLWRKRLSGEPVTKDCRSELSEPDAESSEAETDSSQEDFETAAGEQPGPQHFDLTVDDLDEEEAAFFPECPTAADAPEARWPHAAPAARRLAAQTPCEGKVDATRRKTRRQSRQHLHGRA